MAEFKRACSNCYHEGNGYLISACTHCGPYLEHWRPKAVANDAVRLEDSQEDVLVPPKYTPLPIPECKPVKESDPVSHPNHYCQGGIECKDAIRAAVIGLTGFEAYCTGNIIKYCWRWYHKNGVEDLRKAKTYIDFLIEEVTNK